LNRPDLTLTKTDKAKIELRTAHELTFRLDKRRGICTIPAYTKCYKPRYDRKIKAYLVRMEAVSSYRPPENPPAVCVFLEGMLRYVWRTDVLTEKEYDVIRKEKRDALGVFCKKRKGSVGESRPIRESDSG